MEETDAPNEATKAAYEEAMSGKKLETLWRTLEDSWIHCEDDGAEINHTVQEGPETVQAQWRFAESFGDRSQSFGWNWVDKI